MANKRFSCSWLDKLFYYLLNFFYSLAYFYVVHADFRSEISIQNNTQNANQFIAAYLQSFYRHLKFITEPHVGTLILPILLTIIMLPARALTEESVTIYIIGLLVALVVASALVILFDFDAEQKNLINLICSKTNSPRFDTSKPLLPLLALWTYIRYAKTRNETCMRLLTEWVQPISRIRFYIHPLSYSIKQIIKPTINLFITVAIALVFMAATIVFIAVYDLSTNELIANILFGLFIGLLAALVLWYICILVNKKWKSAADFYKTRGINIYGKRIVRKLLVIIGSTLPFYLITIIAMELLIATTAGITDVNASGKHVAVEINAALILAAAYSSITILLGLPLIYYAPVAAVKYVLKMFETIPLQALLVHKHHGIDTETLRQLLLSEFDYSSNNTNGKFSILRKYPLLWQFFKMFSKMYLLKYARYLIWSFIKDF